jgi:predicted molibdopterin-dependent oxidoreductase YjgC
MNWTPVSALYRLKERRAEMSVTQQFRRLDKTPARTVQFTIDARPVRAQAGDLLLTAMLLNQGYVRRFEFADAKRAGFCFMGACQDCWVSLADGRRVRACDTLVEEGMNVLTGA